MDNPITPKELIDMLKYVDPDSVILVRKYSMGQTFYEPLSFNDVNIDDNSLELIMDFN